MLTLKKLTFAPLFLVVFLLLIYQISPLLRSYDFIFSVSFSTLIELVIISAAVSLSSFLFALFVSLSFDWKYIFPVGILASLIPLLFLDTSLGLVYIIGILVSLLITYLNLDNALKSYLTFQPSSLLGPSIRHLSGLLILSFCLVYFLSTSKIIAQNGFQIPDSLIDTALKFTQPAGSSEQESSTSQINIPQEQIDLLKKNPDLLKKSGLDPKILDTLNSPKSQNTLNTPNDIIKQTIKDQIQSLLKPYLGFVPAVLAVLLFFTLQSLTSIINLLIYPLLWITFYILEKSGFIKFTEEQRPVKKLVI